jgi:hypothetical protein
MLWLRYLGENRFSGSVPPAISALTALSVVYARVPTLPQAEFTARRPASAGTQEPLGCRALFGNRLEGRLPPSLMRIPQLLYALPSVSALDSPMPSPARGWLQPLPARGLPARAARTRGPRQGRQRFRRVRCRAGAPFRGGANRTLPAARVYSSCTQTNARTPAWNRSGDSYNRRTSERSSAGNVGRSVRREWPNFFPAGLSYHELTIVHVLECAWSSVVASKTGTATMHVFLSLQHTRAWLLLHDPIGIFSTARARARPRARQRTLVG